MQLYEKYRPKRLAQIVGQAKALAKVRKLAGLGLGGRAFWISGKSGQGKTTLARCAAALIADPFFVQEFDAGKLTPRDIGDIEGHWRTSGWGKGGRAYIVNEAHGLRKDTLRAMLVMLEPGNIPEHVLFIFTTTVDGMALFEDGQIDASPLLSRCSVIALTSQGLAPVFARLVRGIATREGMNGRALADYVKLANRTKGNCRAMLQAVGEGEEDGNASQQ